MSDSLLAKDPVAGSSDNAVRPLRRDAEVNLGRILTAAHSVFAEHGYNASMEAIAARADVGVGTLYRRFPTKADLFNAVASEERRRVQEIAAGVLLDVAPSQAAFAFLRRCIEVPGAWRAIISTPPWGSQREAELVQIAPLLADIVDRSKSAGTLRPDVEVTDLVVLLKAVRSIADLCEMNGQEPSLRFLELALDGLRPGHRPSAHPALSVGQLAKLLTGAERAQRA